MGSYERIEKNWRCACDAFCHAGSEIWSDDDLNNFYCSRECADWHRRYGSVKAALPAPKMAVWI
jgi:hypothetical protein